MSTLFIELYHTTKMMHTPNYPDILGYITGGPRYNVNVLQIALGVRPRVVRAGRPFEAVLLVQNASDANVDLGVQMEIPERDAKRQKGMFTAGKNRLVVGLRPAEVGYIVLPIGSQPDTAVDNDYRISMQVKVKPLEKPNRIRTVEGGGAIPFDQLPVDLRGSLDELKKLNFSTEKRFGLGDVLETSFSVMPGRLGQITDLHPGWVNLWSMSDHVDSEALVSRYEDAILHKALPQLKHKFTLDLLIAETNTHFAQAGYPLHPPEALCFAKMLAYVLDQAAPTEDKIDPLTKADLNIKLLLKKHAEDQGDLPPSLPHWFDGFLRAVARNEELISVPTKLISRLMFTHLVRDAAEFSFELIEKITGERIGSPAEMQVYIDQLVTSFDQPDKLDFVHTYMPVMMGGIIIHDRVLGDEEHIEESLRGLSDSLDVRDSEVSDDDLFILKMAKTLISRHSVQFGFEA